MHHIFFDDNLHMNPDDSIIAVRLRKGVDMPFRSVTFAEYVALRDVVLVKAHITQAILDPRYFIDKVALCAANYDKYLARE